MYQKTQWILRSTFYQFNFEEFPNKMDKDSGLEKYSRRQGKFAIEVQN